MIRHSSASHSFFNDKNNSFCEGFARRQDIFCSSFILDGYDVINSLLAYNGNIWICCVKMIEISFSGVWNYCCRVMVKVEQKLSKELQCTLVSVGISYVNL